MNLSTNTKKIVRTRDGVPLEEDMVIYVPWAFGGEIRQYTVEHWHNGVNTDLYHPDEGKSSKVSVKGLGGAGIYTYEQIEYDPYRFIFCNDCFAYLIDARKFVERQCIKEYRKLKKIADNAFEIKPTKVRND